MHRLAPTVSRHRPSERLAQELRRTDQLTDGNRTARILPNARGASVRRSRCPDFMTDARRLRMRMAASSLDRAHQPSLGSQESEIGRMIGRRAVAPTTDWRLQFARTNRAGVAQSAERQPSKLNVAGLIPVSPSTPKERRR